MKKNYELPTDEIILEKFKGTNFGSRNKIHLVCEGLLKQVSGYTCGLTLRGILYELNLIKKNGKPTAYGKRCVYSAYKKSNGKENEYQYDNYLSPFEGIKLKKVIRECFVTDEVLENIINQN